MEELLKPLSYWGAILGLAPSWNVLSTIRGQQKFHRAIFWWCMFVFVLQVLEGGYKILMNAFAYREGAFVSFPTAYVVFIYAIAGLSIIISLTPRLPFTHQEKLRNASKKIKQFDFMFYKNEGDFCTENLRKRLRKSFLSGVIWVLVGAFGILFPTLSVWKSAASEQLAVFLAFQLVLVLSFVHVIITFSIFDMVNLIIAIRLKVVVKAFQNLVPTYGCETSYNSLDSTMKFRGIKVVPKNEHKRRVSGNISSSEELNEIRKGFHLLYEASTSFNGAYSLAILLSLCCNLFMCSLSLFILIYRLIASNPFGAIQMIVFSSVIFLSDLSFFLIILSSADKPVTQWRNLLTVVSQSSTMNWGEEDKSEILLFVHQVQNSSFSLSAAGMFHVGTHLIPGIGAAVLTYIIVMLQSAT